eukprot:3520794-Rhodomonas_salina.1
MTESQPRRVRWVAVTVTVTVNGRQDSPSLRLNGHSCQCGPPPRGEPSCRRRVCHNQGRAGRLPASLSEPESVSLDSESVPRTQCQCLSASL